MAQVFWYFFPLIQLKKFMENIFHFGTGMAQVLKQSSLQRMLSQSGQPSKSYKAILLKFV